MLVTITEASKITGKARKTIYAHAKSGKVSLSKFSDGRTAIDTSELDRVYKIDLQKVLPVQQEKVTLGNSDPKLDILLKKIENLESEVNRLNNTVENLNNRLEHKPLPSEPQPLSKPAQVEPVKSKGWQSSYIDRMKESLAKNNKK